MTYQNNILDYLEHVADVLPNKIAVQDEKQSLTFALLKAQSERIGTALSSRFSCVRRPVVILCDRELMAYSAFLGVVQSGNFYVPLEAKMPILRLRGIVEQLEPIAILYLRKYQSTVALFEKEVATLCIEDLVEKSIVDNAVLKKRKEMVLDIDPVYMIFTSGSTGKPKGIVVSHRNLIDFTEWISESCALSATDVLADQAPFYFDTSVKNLYPGLKCGATVHILPKKFFSFPLLLTNYLNEHKVTVIFWSTSAFHMVANSGVFEKEQPRYLRLVAVGGETLYAKQLRIWKQAVPNAVYYNHYGPTETTVDCIAYRIDKDFADDDSIPIGKACNNMEVFILDAQGQPVPCGQTGEIYIRGIGISCGYYGDWAHTKKSFVQNPNNPYYPDLVYRTGDLGYSDSEGNIYFVSRRDHQIKHLGYRIELGDIEMAIHGISDVKDVVCLFDEAADRIVCIYEGSIDEKHLIKELQFRLSKYMLPNRTYKVEKLPHNANGKLDRGRLMEDYIYGSR